ncbi:MAG: DUF4232 domain-containing protein [Rhodoglobus sp.]
MTDDASTQQLPEHNPSSNEVTSTRRKGRVALIVIAIVLALAIIVLLVFVLLRNTGGSTPTPTPTPSASTPSPTPTPTPTQTAAPAVSSCAADSLAVKRGGSDGAAGSTYVTFTFTNSGSTACTLAGYPTMSFVDPGGGVIGAAAAPDTGQPTPQNILQPGDTVQAVLRVTDAGNVDNCDPRDVADISVVSPNTSAPVKFDASGFTGCANGSVNILSVSPIGPAP